MCKYVAAGEEKFARKGNRVLEEKKGQGKRGREEEERMQTVEV